LDPKIVSNRFDFTDGVVLGDKPTYFKLKLYPYKSDLTQNNAIIPVDTEIKVGDNKIVIKEACTNIEWDSKTGMVTGLVNSVRRPIYYVGQGMCTIPLNTKQDAHFIEPRKY
jgi:hypothetical protein